MSVNEVRGLMIFSAGCGIGLGTSLSLASTLASGIVAFAVLILGALWMGWAYEKVSRP